MLGRTGAVAVALAAVLRVAIPEPAPTPLTAPPVSPAAWSLLSLDHPTAAATFAWIDIVRRYGDAPADAAWLVVALEPVGELDPAWQAPWVYGSLMARALGDPVSQEAILRDAMVLHPGEPWFPYALGMSRYLDHGDPQGAATWLERAAALPGAPEVHRRAAEALRELR